VADARGSIAHLILNPAACGAAASMGRLSEAARERGIRVSVLEPGEDARHAARTLRRRLRPPPGS
jgi:hypothetical protein